MPIDPSQQEAMSQAIASGGLDPQDPRVKRKMMELFHLPRELDAVYDDQKVQWEEIELMKNSGQLIQPELIVDNDAVHIETCRDWLNSDEGRDQTNMQVRLVVKQHMQLHVMNTVRMAQMQQMTQGQQQPQQQGPPGKQPSGEQGGQQGGQVPKNPQVRQQRAQKGQAAKPNRPQPPEGNQNRVTRQT